DPGAEYVLVFTARSTVMRDIIAGIGLNEAPWSAAIETVALTTDWQEFTLNLAAFDSGSGQGFGGANSRILFDMGAATGEVHIDNVSLRKVIPAGGEIVSTPDLTGYTLTWSDEFDGTSLNTDDWNIQLGDGTEFGIPGWGNQELQIYTNDPANLAVGPDGDANVLKITALDDGNGGYTSARINTYNKESFRYGKIVARVKLPETQGLWPAFWTLGDNLDQINWPGVGEIDVFEIRGQEPNTSTHTIHYVNAETQYVFNNGDYVNSEDYSAGYNEFMVDWQPNSITWYVNGVQAFQLPIGEGMKEFNRPMHLLLNVAVGGNYPGDPDETTVLPQTMSVDWVRVYEQDGFVPEAPPALVPSEETIGGGGAPVGDGAPADALQTGFSEFGSNIVFNRFGAGGEPSWFSDSDAQDGTSSVRFEYPGGAFGGAWMVTESPRDLTAYANADLVFAIKKPASVADMEVKMESNGGADAGSMFLVNYTATDLGNGWEEYRIPLADFVADGLDLSGVHIPFGLWNPVDAQDNFPAVDILFDAIRLE
ncbi:MAG: family 16 glycosylhydrolase, partial [Gammaproteobacteria bacterium]|nr:family 16 glycosylhydrolase [Gammaproteobacteria bacterium]